MSVLDRCFRCGAEFVAGNIRCCHFDSSGERIRVDGENAQPALATCVKCCGGYLTKTELRHITTLTNSMLGVDEGL